jgi:hypothetical protein
MAFMNNACFCIMFDEVIPSLANIEISLDNNYFRASLEMILGSQFGWRGNWCLMFQANFPP